MKTMVMRYDDLYESQLMHNERLAHSNHIAAGPPASNPRKNAELNDAMSRGWTTRVQCIPNAADEIESYETSSKALDEVPTTVQLLNRGRDQRLCALRNFTHLLVPKLVLGRKEKVSVTYGWLP